MQSSNLQTAIDLVKDGAVDVLGLSPYCGFDGTDISFLRDLSVEIIGLNFPRPDRYDLSIVEELRNLKFLRICDSSQSLDLRGMPLEDLNLDWHSGYNLPLQDAPIRDLCLRRYKPKKKDLSELPEYRALEKLDLIHGNPISLEGVERFGSLRHCELSYMAKLESVRALAKTNIETLFLESTKAVNDLSAISGCPKLRSLVLSKFRDLDSLGFLTDFSSLETFRFVRTKIKDGDMTPLLRLKSVNFIGNRGYSHTPAQIQTMIGQPVFEWDKTEKVSP